MKAGLYKPGAFAHAHPLLIARALLWAVLTVATAAYAGYATRTIITGGPGRQLGREIDRAMAQGAAFRPFDRSAVAQLRVQARHDPLDARNIRLLSVTAAMRGDGGNSGNLLRLADRITRRDLLTQLALIEDAVGRGDVHTALDRYAIALTTSRRADTTLLPVLTGALAEPAVRSDLARRIRTATAWRERFLDYAVSSAPPSFVAPLLIGWLSDAAVLHRYQAMLLDRYVSLGDYADAFRFGELIGGPDRREIATVASSGKRRDARFGPLAWQLNGEGEIQALAQEGRLKIFVSPDAGGTAASLLLGLVPGRYTLTQRLTAESASGIRAAWEWRCLRANDAPPARSVDVPLREGPVTLRIELDVPPGCDAMRLGINVNADFSATASELTVDQLDIKPQSRNGTSHNSSRKLVFGRPAIKGWPVA